MSVRICFKNIIKMEMLIITIIISMTIILLFCMLYNDIVCHSDKILEKYITQAMLCLQIAGILLEIIILIKKYNLL